jgi:hypothetical protein
MILFARPQLHARRRAQGIIGVSPVSRFPPRATIESLKVARKAVRRFPAVIPRHRRDAYDTFRSASASRTSPSPRYHRRLACVPIPPKGDDRKPERQTLPTEPFADFQPSFRGTGGTPMILFARPQLHARRQAYGIIGVSPVSRIPAKGDDRKPKRQTLPAEPSADFQPSFPGTGGTPMILFARPQLHARHRAHSIIGVSPVFPDSRQGRRSKA